MYFNVKILKMKRVYMFIKCEICIILLLFRNNSLVKKIFNSYINKYGNISYRSKFLNILNNGMNFFFNNI